jgi:hypothetical protein
VIDEEQRHQCETRDWIRRRAQKDPQRGREWLGDVLRDIEKRRGREAAERLKRDISEQWARGNRGAPGDWREA